MGNRHSAPSSSSTPSASHWLSRVLPVAACEPMDTDHTDLGMSMGSDLENLQDKVLEVVDFPDLLNHHTIEVDHNEGLTAQVSVPFVRKAELDEVMQTRPTFLMQHLYVLEAALRAVAGSLSQCAEYMGSCLPTCTYTAHTYSILHAQGNARWSAR